MSMNTPTPKPTAMGTNSTTKAMMLMSMVMTGTITLSEDDVNAITRILLSALAPASPTMIPSNLSLSENNNRRSTVRGLSELAEIIGVSLPTACKLAQSGKFAAAELNFGTKKKVWDREKLLEIAQAHTHEKK